MADRRKPNKRHAVKRVSFGFGCILAAQTGFPAAAAGNDGPALFEKECQACHTLSADEPRRQGPALNGIIGRTAGKAAGFPYSNGLKQADWAWTEERLDAWLANPKQVFGDTYMIYKQEDAGVRQQIISFLKTMSE
jgi:cytochrome c